MKICVYLHTVDRFSCLHDILLMFLSVLVFFVLSNSFHLFLAEYILFQEQASFSGFNLISDYRSLTTIYNHYTYNVCVSIIVTIIVLKKYFYIIVFTYFYFIFSVFVFICIISILFQIQIVRLI